jgi:hypothetical protein
MLDNALRNFEQELDQYYKTFKLYAQPSDIRLYALLASYDSMVLPLASVPGAPLKSSKAVLFFKTLDDSLNYCIRWLSAPKPSDLLSTSDSQIIESADNLLSFGSDYADIADMHMMYGRGLVKVEVDESQRKIRFIIKDEHTDKKEIHGFLQTYAYHKKLARQNMKKNVQLTADIAKTLSKISFECYEGRIIIKDITLLKTPVIRGSLGKEVTSEILRLDENVDLGGFSFGDYKKFWLALFNWSNCLLFLYLKTVSNGMAQEECMPTQLLNEKHFISNIKILSDISEEAIINITDRLSYDWGNNKADILLRPFIRVGEKMLWSPFLITKLKYEKNMLKLMSRTPKLKSISDNIIGQRERQFLRLIGSNLAQKHGYQFKLNTSISSRDQNGEVDILAYKTEFPAEILIVEAKTALMADETNEIADVTEKLIDAQEQVKKALEILKSLNSKEKGRLFKFVDWDKVTEYYPIIMTPDSHPNTLYEDEIVPHIAYSSLITFAKPKNISRPFRLWNFCKNKSWIKEMTPEKEYEYKDVHVGDITYSLPYIKTKNS